MKGNVTSKYNEMKISKTSCASSFVGKVRENWTYICILKENYWFQICNNENSLLLGYTLKLYGNKSNKCAMPHGLKDATHQMVPSSLSAVTHTPKCFQNSYFHITWPHNHLPLFLPPPFLEFRLFFLSILSLHCCPPCGSAMPFEGLKGWCSPWKTGSIAPPQFLAPANRQMVQQSHSFRGTLVQGRSKDGWGELRRQIAVSVTSPSIQTLGHVSNSVPVRMSPTSWMSLSHIHHTV